MKGSNVEYYLVIKVANVEYILSCHKCRVQLTLVMSHSNGPDDLH